MKVIKKLLYTIGAALLILAITAPLSTNAASIFPFGDIGWGGEPQDMANSLQILLVITILALAPSILIMMTGFTRIVIVLSFVRQALGTQQMPPNQVLIGLALFLTLFVMTPTVTQINEVAYAPYLAEEINEAQAVERAMVPIRTFMLKQTYARDMNLFISLSGEQAPENIEEIKMSTLIPAFITSEIKRGFQIGFFVYIPFVVIDMIVASTLMSMGMMMLPPVMISLPFKILLFVMIDGWGLTVKTLVEGFG